jgi:hypothetical protein
MVTERHWCADPSHPVAGEDSRVVEALHNKLIAAKTGELDVTDEARFVIWWPITLQHNGNQHHGAWFC